MKNLIIAFLFTFNISYAHETGEFLKGHTHPAFELNIFLLLIITFITIIYVILVKEK